MRSTGIFRRTALAFTLAAWILAGMTLLVHAPAARAGVAEPFAPRTGLYFNPDRDGVGLDVQRVGNALFVLWFTFRPDGTPIWYIGVADLKDMSWSADVDLFSWDTASRHSSDELIGSMSLDWSDAQNAEFSWTLNGSSHSEPVQSLIFGTGPTRVDYSGSYYYRLESGWGITIATQGRSSVMLVYFYDADGEPTWGIFVDQDSDFILNGTLQILSGPGLCPSCSALKGGGFPAPEYTDVADMNVAYVRTAILDNDEVSPDDFILRMGLNYKKNTVNAGSPLGGTPFSVISLPPQTLSDTPFVSLEPITEPQTTLTEDEFAAMRTIKSMHVAAAANISQRPPVCNDVTPYSISFSFPPNRYALVYSNAVPVAFQNGFALTDQTKMGFFRAGDDTVAFVWSGSLGGIVQSFTLAGRSSDFFDDPASGFSLMDAMNVETVDNLGQTNITRAAFTASSKVCATADQ